ncbi:cellulose-binding domain-containing protein [Actinocrinis sp.]|uniref:cellulose-binding domain-containing protein n=1 Tax=Actinocrinis sp. TaxID=1920516 RepID=UPI002C0E8121|nr:cellulose-binding domain-containing protein [Actinocrinis sp.]HXR69692.1 cellulose-binding domain-containing protein [Actinocrinis sp.]
MIPQLLRHKRALLLAPLAPLAAGLVAVTTTSASAATGCQATYSVTSQWNVGFGASVSITNLGSPVSSWKVAWTFPGNQQVTQLWNGTVSQSGQSVTVTNASYNGSVGTNASVSFGFNGSYSGTNSAPSAISFNGVTCTGTVTPGSPSPTPTHSTSPSPSPSATPSGGGNGTPCHASTCVQYNGGSNGVITQSPKVYLVFYGSQWGSSGGATQTQNEGFFKGLGTGGERWSNVLTQYCNAVPAGTQTCPPGAVHIPYPSSSVFGGTWIDTSQPAPAAPGDDLITEARAAAGHFGASGALSRSIFIIFSPAGTSAGGGYSWHTTTSDGYNVINAAYGEQNTIVTSHEYAETMTDVNAGWTTADKTSEVADLCGPDGNLNLTTGSFPVTSIWSNQDSGCAIAD